MTGARYVDELDGLELAAELARLAAYIADPPIDCHDGDQVGDRIDAIRAEVARRAALGLRDGERFVRWGCATGDPDCPHGIHAATVLARGHRLTLCASLRFPEGLAVCDTCGSPARHTHPEPDAWHGPRWGDDLEGAR